LFRLAIPIKRQCQNSALGGAGLNFDFQQIPGHRSVVLEALHPGQTQAHHKALFKNQSIAVSHLRDHVPPGIDQILGSGGRGHHHRPGQEPKETARDPLEPVKMAPQI